MNFATLNAYRCTCSSKTLWKYPIAKKKKKQTIELDNCTKHIDGASN